MIGLHSYNLDAVETATGIWQVEYSAENRPIRWTQGAKVITMAFDRLGRRSSYREPFERRWNNEVSL